jgi:hypothetical protein
MEIAIGAEVLLKKGNTFVHGHVDGIKVENGQLEKISIESLSSWFYMNEGWDFVELLQDEETDAEV